jgi:glycosyltransferase involved in cell wall biosynthesis
MRIFWKQCLSVAQAGYDTHLIITASSEDVTIAKGNGVHIHALPEASSRFTRMLHTTWRCFIVAFSLKADIYQFHDPELIPFALLLRLLGKKVIYDVHEDLPEDILNKEWIPLFFRRAISSVVRRFEDYCASKFSSVMVPTPKLLERFKNINTRTLMVGNFPILREFSDEPKRLADVGRVLCYVGGLSRGRGIYELLDALVMLKFPKKLILCGEFSDPLFGISCKNHPAWSYVLHTGQVDRDGILTALRQSMVGIVTLHPTKSYKEALPVKMFEYMAAGLPVLASNFPIWSEIIESEQCGVCVNPNDPKEMADALEILMNSPDKCQKMGLNGRYAVFSKYSWESQKDKLIQCYNTLLNK